MGIFIKKERFPNFPKFKPNKRKKYTLDTIEDAIVKIQMQIQNDYEMYDFLISTPLNKIGATILIGLENDINHYTKNKQKISMFDSDFRHLITAMAYSQLRYNADKYFYMKNIQKELKNTTK